MGDAPHEEDTTEVETYDDIEVEVSNRFDGDWVRFLRAVTNPAEILHFVLAEHCDKDRDAFEKWAQSKELPPDWVPRFYGTLTADGELISGPLSN